jgi:hypothetical protein
MTDDDASQHLPEWSSAFSAVSKSDPDLLSFDQAMKSDEADLWKEAALKEIDALVEKGTWKEVAKTDATERILPGTWVFKRKRNPSGAVTKHKARYCVRGDLEETKEDNHSPVCASSTVRLFLVLSLILDWYTCSIDFSNAFVQSYLPDGKKIWIHLPRGFGSTNGSGTCLQLIKSLYGIGAAPKLFYETAIRAFTKLGFKQSRYDPCLLFRSDCFLCLYVDDVGIAAAKESTIDELIAQLRKLGFELTKENSFTEFLGIDFVKQPDGSILLTQTGLIDKILEATNMVDCNPNSIPASPQALGTDEIGPAMTESWNYLSVVGMLLYLTTNTRVDIAFPVSQVARFSANPKQSHATAVKTIIRYLKGTRLMGTIMRPQNNLNVEMYVDADFGGLYGCEDDRNPTSAKSRTGYVILLAGCPLVWRSQIQKCVTKSTVEAEYVALSDALQVMLPLKRMIVELSTALSLPPTISATILATVFEDNNGALILATTQRLTNRTKYLLLRWHWFWGFYPSEFLVLKIESRNQRGDYLTKQLTRDGFEHNRLLVQGW